MQIRTSIDGCKAMLQLEGKLTVQTSPDLGNEVDGLPEEVCDIDIDLTGVTYIASAGLRVLVGIDKLAVSRGGRMRLLHPSDYVMDVFEMTELSEVFIIER